MMKGYIDLVFEHAGRYYLADYKTNYLGATAADYLPAQLEPAMRASHYDLQYLIYSVALHRHLRNRLPDYDYARDFGGVYYLFLRGMDPAHEAGCGIFFEQPAPSLIQALDELFAGGSGYG
jgi:exodeoxyribonuclease V beta subunit